MKVFDFTNGVKGRQVGEIGLVEATGGWFVRKGDKQFKVTLADAPEGWSWLNSAHNGKGEIKAEDFGVEAICFCAGEMIAPHQEWMWHVIGTQDWNRNACKAGILKAEKL